MAKAASKGGGIMFSGKYVAKSGGDGSPLPPVRTPSTSKVSHAPGVKSGQSGPQVSPTEQHPKGKY